MKRHEPNERKSWEFESTTFTEQTLKSETGIGVGNGMLANRDNDDVKKHKELLTCATESFYNHRRLTITWSKVQNVFINNIDYINIYDF